MDSIVKQLKQFKADAIYEKKKHYNAAERKRRYYRILSFIQIFLNAITGTTLLTVVFGKGSKMAEIIALILTIIATILASIQKICDYEKQAQGNAKAADMYLRISKKISLTLNFIKDKLLSEQDVMKRAEEIQSEMSQANEIGLRQIDMVVGMEQRLPSLGGAHVGDDLVAVHVGLGAAACLPDRQGKLFCQLPGPDGLAGGLNQLVPACVQGAQAVVGGAGVA